MQGCPHSGRGAQKPPYHPAEGTHALPRVCHPRDLPVSAVGLTQHLLTVYRIRSRVLNLAFEAHDIPTPITHVHPKHAERFTIIPHIKYPLLRSPDDLLPAFSHLTSCKLENYLPFQVLPLGSGSPCLA